jgi:hypothetical protein
MDLIHLENHSAAFAFKAEVLFDLVDTLYRQKHGLTVTGNYSL